MPAPMATAGGVDWRAAANAALASRWAKPIVFTAALVPLVWTVWLAYTGVHPGNPKARLRRIKVAVSDGDVVISVPDAREATPVMQEADISVA